MKKVTIKEIDEFGNMFETEAVKTIDLDNHAIYRSMNQVNTDDSEIPFELTSFISISRLDAIYISGMLKEYFAMKQFPDDCYKPVLNKNGESILELNTNGYQAYRKLLKALDSI